MMRLLLAVLLLAGCSSNPEPARLQDPPSATDLVLRQWTGTPIPDCPVEVTFFGNGSFGGTAGEDGFGGEYRIEDGMVTVTGLRSPGTSSCEPKVREWLAAPVTIAVSGMDLALGPDRFRTGDSAVSTLAASLVGLSEAFARRLVETNDLQIRVIERDGVSATVTQEFRSDRIDIAVKDDVVTRADVG